MDSGRQGGRIGHREAIVALKNRVVAHFLNGQVLKGTTQDFIPSRPYLHIFAGEGEGSIRVAQNELKALFFVKNLDGDPQRIDIPAFTGGPAESAYGRKIAVRFPDGELICGYSLAYSTARDGFFMATMDSRGNNERIYIVVSPGVAVLEGQAAEQMLRRWSNTEAA
jgi:hypothetical protein